MKIQVINKSATSVFLDLDGDDTNHDTTVVVGPKASVQVEVNSESDLERLKVVYPNCIFR